MLILLIITTTLSAGAPRVSLTHFENDLQKMAKSSKISVAKKGSFVDRLSTKRQQKEAIEKELAALQQEVDQLQAEVAQLEAVQQACEQATQQVLEKIDKQTVVAQQVTEQFEYELTTLRTMNT